MKKRVLYSEANYAAIVREQGYFVDKTAYIAKLEQVENPVFIEDSYGNDKLYSRVSPRSCLAQIVMPE